MYWMELCGGDETFYRDLLGWTPGADVFTVDGRVVAGRSASGEPGWRLHAVVDDLTETCRLAEKLGAGVVAAGTSATVTDPAGASFVVRDGGRRAELSHRPMTFTWAELCTPDQDAARSFYCGLFGWDAVGVPMAMPTGEVGYTVFLDGTRETAGLLPAEGGFGPAAPPYWLSYVEAPDADGLAARTEELGGEVLVAPFDVPRIGRIAMLAGRTGETFAVMRMPDDGGEGS